MQNSTIRHLKQAISNESLFNVLGQWCMEGAGKKDWRIRLLSAFVSGGAIRALEPFFDVFLADGNSLEIIFGIDRGGTDQNAIRQLYALSKAYPGLAKIQLFNAPASNSIFHPKLYILEGPDTFSGVLGSSNLTLSGIGSNLESLLLFQNFQSNDRIATQLKSIWNSFAEPKSPLQASFVSDLTPKLFDHLLKNSPTSSSEEHGKKSKDDLWKPLSSIKLPRTQSKIGREPVPHSGQAYLICDILNETRSTQMQIPLEVVEKFIGVKKDESVDLEISIFINESLSQAITRPLVISQGNEGKRLMRRLEMPTIRNLKRPLTAFFLKLEKKHAFAYILCPQGTQEHKTLHALLDVHGQQGARERRYYIGSPQDKLWPYVKQIFEAPPRIP